MNFKKIIFTLGLIFTLICGVQAQQYQTQTAPLYSVNAKYTNGVAPGYAPTAGVGLVLNLSSGTANCSSTIILYAGGNLTLTASSTNYVYLDTTASCAPAFNTSGFTGTQIPIAIVTTSGTAITSINDTRTIFSTPGESGTPSFSSITGGTNTGQTMNVGTSSVLTPTGSGIISANEINGVPFCTGFTPTNGQVVEYTTGGTPNPCYNAATPSSGGLNGVNKQITSYPAISGDNGKTIVFNCPSNCSLTLPSPPSSTWTIFPQNYGITVLSVIPPSGVTIDGILGTAQLNPNMGISIWTDGTNYFTNRGGILTNDNVVPILVQSFSQQCGGGACDIAFPSDVTPGDAIIVEYQHSEGGTQLISDTNGDVFPSPNVTNLPGQFDLTQYVVCSAVGGPTTINNTGVYTYVAVYEVANIASSSCQDGYNGAGNGTPAQPASVSTGAVTTTHPYDFVLVSGGTRGGSTQTITEANGYTSLITSGFIATALNYQTFYTRLAATGSVSDTITGTGSGNTNIAGSILALKPAASSNAITEGDVIVAGPDGGLQPLHPGTIGNCWVSNGPLTMPGYRSCLPTALPNGTTATTQTTGDNSTKVATDAFVLANVGGNWPPSGAGPTFSPVPGSYGSGVTVTDTCPGSSTPFVSLGTTPVAGGSGVTLSGSTQVFGSCQGSGYFTTGSGNYTITAGFAFPNNGFENGSASSVTSAALSTFSSPLTSGSMIVVFMYGSVSSTTFSVTDTAGNSYVDCGAGQVAWNSSITKGQCFYALNTTTTASNVVTINTSSSTTFFTGTAVEITGAAASSPIDGGSGVGFSILSNGIGGSAGSNNLTATSLTPAGNGDLILGMFGGSSSAPTIGTSPNLFVVVNSSAHALEEHFTQAVSAAITATASDATSSDPYGALVIAIKP